MSTPFLNDRIFIVSEDLHRFLQEIRVWAASGYNESLWIDAICIDQKCVVEPGHQVQLMGSIYTDAQKVLVWLGCQYQDELIDFFYNWLCTAHYADCPARCRQHWDAICLETFWQRAWIKQEILLAKEVTVVFRGAELEWSTLGKAIARSGDLDWLYAEHAAHPWTFWD